MGRFHDAPAHGFALAQRRLAAFTVSDVANGFYGAVDLAEFVVEGHGLGPDMAFAAGHGGQVDLGDDLAWGHVGDLIARVGR